MFGLAFIIACCIWTASAETSCCTGNGCYLNWLPFRTPLPRCITEIQPTMHLYTNVNSSVGQPVTRNSLPSILDYYKTTVFITHGWEDDGNATWIFAVKDGLLNKTSPGYNVIIVGWDKGSKNLDYRQSALDTRTIGNEIGLVAANLKVPKSQLYCIGHSLGAHVCGFAGMTTKFGRITGLDPAGPYINFNTLTDHLNPTCADYVDVIHTDGDKMGTMNTLGHVDFYPNGGEDQPGCLAGLRPTDDIHVDADTRKLQIADLYWLECSHTRVRLLFIESIQKPCFVSQYKCTDQHNLPSSCSRTATDQTQSMGFHSNEFKGRGIFFLRTNKTAPYCLG